MVEVLFKKVYILSGVEKAEVSSSEDSSDEDEKPAKKKPKKEESSSEESSEDEVETRKKGDSYSVIDMLSRQQCLQLVGLLVGS